MLSDMAHGITLTLKAITPSADFLSSDNYGRIFCHHWEERMQADWALARHLKQKLPPRNKETYRAARRNKQRTRRNLH